MRFQSDKVKEILSDLVDNTDLLICAKGRRKQKLGVAGELDVGRLSSRPRIGARNQRRLNTGRHISSSRKPDKKKNLIF